ncbi:MAG: O-antigen ligase family protein [Ruminococcus sp.]|nr:O-antigen ligase family protein [Ruminococcus sp.]
MIQIGKKELYIEDILVFLYFAIMYAHNAPYPRLFTICSIVIASGYFLSLVFSGSLIIDKEQYRVLGWYLFFAIYELIVSFVNNIYQTLLWNNVLQNILILFIMCCYVTSKEKFIRLLKVFAYSALYFGMAAWLTSPVSTWGTTEFAGITQSQRNTIAYVVGTGFVLFMFFWLEKKNKLHLVCAMLCALVTILTGSRKGIVQLLIPVFLYIALQEGVRKRFRAIAVVAVVGAFVVLIASNSTLFMDTYGTRFFEMFAEDTDDASVLAREGLAELGMRLFWLKPIFGYGLGASYQLTAQYGWGVVNYFHNNYVEMLTCGGIIGFVIYHISFLKSLSVSWRNRHDNNLAKLILTLIAVYFVLGVGQVTVYYATFYPILFFILKGRSYVTEMSTNGEYDEIEDYEY